MVVTFILTGLILLALALLTFIIRMFNGKPKKKIVLTALLGLLLVTAGVLISPGSDKTISPPEEDASNYPLKSEDTTQTTSSVTQSNNITKDTTSTSSTTENSASYQTPSTSTSSSNDSFSSSESEQTSSVEQTTSSQTETNTQSQTTSVESTTNSVATETTSD